MSKASNCQVCSAKFTWYSRWRHDCACCSATVCAKCITKNFIPAHFYRDLSFAQVDACITCSSLHQEEIERDRLSDLKKFHDAVRAAVTRIGFDGVPKSQGRQYVETSMGRRSEIAIPMDTIQNVFHVAFDRGYEDGVTARCREVWSEAHKHGYNFAFGLGYNPIALEVLQQRTAEHPDHRVRENFLSGFDAGVESAIRDKQDEIEQAQKHSQAQAAALLQLAAREVAIREELVQIHRTSEASQMQQRQVESQVKILESVGGLVLQALSTFN